MKKKVLIIVLIIILLAILSFITNYVDKGRVATGNEPKYTIKIVTDGGNKVTYWGLGYKVVRLTKVSPSEPYKNSLDIKYGTWFMNNNFFVANNSKNNNEIIESELTLDKVKMTIKEGTLSSATILIHNASIDDIRITENGLELIKKKTENGKKRKQSITNMFLMQ